MNQKNKKRKVLIVNPHFLPGYRCGGPQRTIENICRCFCKKADIYLVTKNHDLGTKKTYDVPTETWVRAYGIMVMYVPDRKYNLLLFEKLYNQFERIYACGLFCKSTIELMIVHKMKNALRKLYVAPMGVFTPSALSIRYPKKKCFLLSASMFSIFQDIIWSFTSVTELQYAYRAIGKNNITHYIIAEDLPRNVMTGKDQIHCLEKKKNELKIVFLSRISPKKNLLEAIEIVNYAHCGRFIFDIYGPVEDEKYWHQCRQKIRAVSCKNTIIDYKGEIRPEHVPGVMSQYDVFLFPTKGENYGHVIFEALAGGCLPLVSDKTIWKDFERRRCGCVISLNDIVGFRKKLDEYVRMENTEYSIYRQNAVDYAEEKYRVSMENSGYSQVFL